MEVISILLKSEFWRKYCSVERLVVWKGEVWKVGVRWCLLLLLLLLVLLHIVFPGCSSRERICGLRPTRPLILFGMRSKGGCDRWPLGLKPRSDISAMLPEKFHYNFTYNITFKVLLLWDNDVQDGNNITLINANRKLHLEN